VLRPLSVPTRLVLPVITAILLLLAGCLGSGPGDGTDGPPPGEPDGAGDEAQEGSPLEELPLVPDELVHGVHWLEERVLGDAGVIGYVFDEQSREVIAGATVIVQCHLEGIGLPVSPQVANTDENGRFAVPLGEMACDQLSYQALKPGYLPHDPLDSAPGEAAGQYLVFIGLQPSD
jgi:hypothetical protein